MNISFEEFAYKKKPPIQNIIDSDSDSSSIQCIDDQINNKEISPLKKKAYIISESENEQEEEEDISVRKSKRKRICISDTEDELQVIKSCKQRKIVATDDKSYGHDIEENSLVETKSFPLALIENLQNTNKGKGPQIVDFLESCSIEQLINIPGCSKTKAEAIISKRPYVSYEMLVESMKFIKNLNTEQFLDECVDYLNERSKFDELLQQCEELSNVLQEQLLVLNQNADDVEKLPVQQPVCVDDSLKLKNYQIVGLNWLAMLHARNLNGILADQMGLGKTIQALTFIGYLLENGYNGPHVIVCPCSTLQNWIREFEKWLPDVPFIQYNGNQNERRHIRLDIIDGEIVADVIITSSNIIASTKQDRSFFKNLGIEYLILDEAHMIKNMKTERYKHLQNLRANRKLLLTGTPLQNDVYELMSLLTFLMPNMFEGCEMKQFALQRNTKSTITTYEKELLCKAKKILKPFVLRRLKKDVLNDLPAKIQKHITCNLTSGQRRLYEDCLTTYLKNEHDNFHSGVALLMKLRKIACHPLLVRQRYTNDQLKEMAQEYAKSPFHDDCDVNYVNEDMSVMSDYELHQLCKKEASLKKYMLTNDDVCDCGKMKWLDENLPKLKQNGDRVLVFSQFVIALDILEDYLKLRQLSFLRIDGSTKSSRRQELIDEYNNNPHVFIFLLSTRAGGLGINVTSANTVIFYDIDFNPYNDKQAEDRCHRVGQKREVTVYRCIVKDTVEENILKCGEKKLLLEKEVIGGNEQDNIDDDTSKAVLLLLQESISKQKTD